MSLIQILDKLLTTNLLVNTLLELSGSKSPTTNNAMAPGYHDDRMILLARQQNGMEDDHPTETDQMAAAVLGSVQEDLQSIKKVMEAAEMDITTRLFYSNNIIIDGDTSENKQGTNDSMDIDNSMHTNNNNSSSQDDSVGNSLLCRETMAPVTSQPK
jgi:hypothetical protein